MSIRLLAGRRLLPMYRNSIALHLDIVLFSSLEVGPIHARDSAVGIQLSGVKWPENLDDHFFKKIWNSLLNAQFA